MAAHRSILTVHHTPRSHPFALTPCKHRTVVKHRHALRCLAGVLTAAHAATSRVPAFAAASLSFQQQKDAAIQAFSKLPLYVSVPLLLLGLWIVKRVHEWLKGIIWGRTVVRLLAPKLYLPKLSTQGMRAAEERRARAMKKQGLTQGVPLPIVDPTPASEKMSPEEEALAAERLFSPTGMARQDIEEWKQEAAQQPMQEEEMEVAFRRMGDDRSAEGTALTPADLDNPFLKMSEQLTGKTAAMRPGTQ